MSVSKKRLQRNLQGKARRNLNLKQKNVMEAQDQANDNQSLFLSGKRQSACPCFYWSVKTSSFTTALKYWRASAQHNKTSSTCSAQWAFSSVCTRLSQYKPLDRSCESSSAKAQCSKALNGFFPTKKSDISLSMASIEFPAVLSSHTAFAEIKVSAARKAKKKGNKEHRGPRTCNRRPLTAVTCTNSSTNCSCSGDCNIWKRAAKCNTTPIDQATAMLAAKSPPKKIRTRTSKG